MDSASETGTPLRWLGRVTYEDGLALQESLVEKRAADEAGDVILYLEHEPVFTIGRTRDRSSLAAGQGVLPHPVQVINRGGQATYHGPGQLVGYLIVDLHAYGQDLHAYLRAIEEGLIEYLQSCGLAARRREGLTGVWIENRKMASIGVGVRRWITMHGFALNVSRDLSGFDAIVPCGIENVTMTSMEIETGRPRDLREVAESLHPFLDRSLTRLSR
jgi:lipoyl(octanoyl) transferase